MSLNPQPVCTPTYRAPAELLPHVPPFLFVDEIESCDARSIITRRRVPLHEPWTEAHFPNRPLVPGVHLIEGMAQTCGLLARLSSSDGAATGRGGRLAQVKNAMFHREVLPGALLTYRAERTVTAGSLHRFDATVSVDGVVAASATLSLALL